MLGEVYHQGRNDVWASSPKEIHAYLEAWAAKVKAQQATR